MLGGATPPVFREGLPAAQVAVQAGGRVLDDVLGQLVHREPLEREALLGLAVLWLALPLGSLEEHADALDGLTLFVVHDVHEAQVLGIDLDGCLLAEFASGTGAGSLALVELAARRVPSAYPYGPPRCESKILSPLRRMTCVSMTGVGTGRSSVHRGVSRGGCGFDGSGGAGSASAIRAATSEGVARVVSSTRGVDSHRGEGCCCLGVEVDLALRSIGVVVEAVALAALGEACRYRFGGCGEDDGEVRQPEVCGVQGAQKRLWDSVEALEYEA